MSLSNEPDRCYCKGTEKSLVMISNPPGLDSINFRIGKFGQFKENMFASLVTPSLKKLTTRSTDDLIISTIDSCAMICDILSFYQERITNEGYIRTAKEKKSVIELARTVGYKLKPGISAKTFLSFILENPLDPFEEVLIGNGTKVQSIPGPNEEPQIFETEEELLARPEWNAIPASLISSTTENLNSLENKIFLKGLNLGLSKGDEILIVTNSFMLTLMPILKYSQKDENGSTIHKIVRHSYNDKRELTPQEIDEISESLLDYFNQENISADHIDKKFEIAWERDIGKTIGTKILSARNGTFDNLKQIIDISGIGPERFTEMALIITGKLFNDFIDKDLDDFDKFLRSYGIDWIKKSDISTSQNFETIEFSYNSQVVSLRFKNKSTAELFKNENKITEIGISSKKGVALVMRTKGTVKVKRTQEGCLRFSYFPTNSKLPHHYRCIVESSNNELKSIKPIFNSTQYGNPAYAQLNINTPLEIREGADNGSEMGVFNHLYQSHRLRNIKTSLDEYTKFGTEVGIILVDEVNLN